MPTLTPSALLAYSLLTAEHFGLDGSTLDTPPNFLIQEIASARLRLADLVPEPPSDGSGSLTAAEQRWQDALAYFTTARLMRRLASDKALHVGLVTGRGGQVNTPLGSHAEVMKAAQGYYAEARQLYPAAAWPDLDPQTSGGTVRVRRVY